MQFTKFGQTGLTNCRMILGTGTFGKQTDEKEAHRMLGKAAEAGINFIDTAEVYPLGAEVGGAEIVAGRWLNNKAGRVYPRHKGRRKNGASHLGCRQLAKTPSSINFVNAAGLRPQDSALVGLCNFPSFDRNHAVKERTHTRYGFF